MVIQCRQCRTKYYFDDALMEEDGLWMRCSRCGHVFFQANPQSETLFGKTPEHPEADIAEKTAGPESAPIGDAADISFPEGKDEDVIRFLDNVLEAKKETEEKETGQRERPPRRELKKKRFDIDQEGETAAETFSEASAPKPRQGLKGWKVLLWSLLVIVVIPALIYFVFYPQIGGHFVNIAHKYLREPEPARPEVVIAQVKLEGVNQRTVLNEKIGEIRVMEGVAYNQADYAIARILLKAVLVDENSRVLGEQLSYAGNVLTDEELRNLSAEEIEKILLRPEGANGSNDKIAPGGKISFMVVFSHEPPGVIKTTLTVVGAERLL